MKPRALLKHIPSFLAAAGLLSATCLGASVPAFADDGPDSQQVVTSSSDDDGSKAASGDDASAGQQADPTPAETPTPAATPRALKHPKPTYTLPPKLKHPKPKYTLPPKVIKSPAPTASDSVAGSSSASSSSTSSQTVQPGQQAQQQDQAQVQQGEQAATPSPSASASAKLKMGALAEGETDPADGLDPSCVVASDGTFNYYLPLSLDTPVRGGYPFNTEKITWAESAVPAGATLVTVVVTGPSASTLTAPPKDRVVSAENLQNGAYSARAYVTMEGNSADAPEGVNCDAASVQATATAVPFDIKKAVPTITAPASISYNNYNPIPISGSGFRPGTTVTITATDASSADTGCSITVKLDQDGDGSFQVARQDFSGDCFYGATGTATITATPSSAADDPASTKATITDEDYVNPSDLTIDTKKLHVGDTTVLHATGFAPGATVTFNWQPNSGSYFTLGTAVADADGNADFTWQVGDDEDGMPIDTGTGTVVAMDDQGNYATCDAAILAEATDPVIEVQSPDVTVNPTPVTLTTKSPITNNTTNNKYFNTTNNYFNTTKTTKATTTTKTLPATGGGSQTLPYTGTNVLSTAVLAAMLIGAGAVALIARRRFATIQR